MLRSTLNIQYRISYCQLELLQTLFGTHTPLDWVECGSNNVCPGFGTVWAIPGHWWRAQYCFDCFSSTEFSPFGHRQNPGCNTVIFKLTLTTLDSPSSAFKGHRHPQCTNDHGNLKITTRGNLVGFGSIVDNPPLLSSRHGQWYTVNRTLVSL